jgi:hypothetical protein
MPQVTLEPEPEPMDTHEMAAKQERPAKPERATKHDEAAEQEEEVDEQPDEEEEYEEMITLRAADFYALQNTLEDIRF